MMNNNTFQDDFFTISPLLTSPEVEWKYERAPVYVLAEEREQYGKEAEQGDL